MVNVYVEIYGCQSNQDDGSIMKGLLLENGFNLSNLNESDIVIVNTCVVKDKTANKIRERIKNIYKNKKVIIAGCMAEAESNICVKLFPNASLVNTFHVSSIVEAVNKSLNNEVVRFLGRREEVKVGLPKIISNGTAVVQIAQGCTNFCSFCETKLAKGNIMSYDEEDIIKEIRELKKSCNKIYLSSTDNGAYGLEKNSNLINLLRRIVEIDGDFKIRVGMMNPWHAKRMLNGLIDVYEDNKIMKFLHIPVQSGSDKILKDMKRIHSVKDFENIVNKFREEINDMNIATDIIVGYPTESYEDFMESVELIKKIKPEVLNIAKFSSRPGTKASKLKQLSSEEVKKRSVIMTNVWNEIRKEIIY